MGGGPDPPRGATCVHTWRDYSVWSLCRWGMGGMGVCCCWWWVGCCCATRAGVPAGVVLCLMLGVGGVQLFEGVGEIGVGVFVCGCLQYVSR